MAGRKGQEVDGRPNVSDAKFRDVAAIMRGGETAKARATGNNAAWMCVCAKDSLPLIATWFPQQSETVCPKRGRRYKFMKESDRVEELV